MSPTEYTRFVAHWMVDADDLHTAPSPTGNPVVDALVAAAAAHVAFSVGNPVPDWADEPDRFLPAFWYPGPDALFANALVHSPLCFTLHGVLIEEDSLKSI